jgi:hypothetical protein
MRLRWSVWYRVVHQVLLNVLAPGVCPAHTTRADAGERSAQLVGVAAVTPLGANGTQRSYIKEDYWSPLTSLEVRWREKLHRESAVLLKDRYVTES